MQYRWLLFMFSSLLWAHGPLHEQIATLTTAIERQPGNTRLYVQRAELHRLHADFPAATADLDRAARLDPALHSIQLTRGRLLLDAGRPELSIRAFDRYLRSEPRDPHAIETRARAQEMLGRFPEAALGYADAITASTDPTPELFLACARAWRRAGDPTRSLQVLETAAGKLGSLIVFDLEALDIEISQSRFGDALARLDRMMAATPRKEQWLVRKASILDAAGRSGEARQARQSALKEIESLPPNLRRAPAITTLEKDLRRSP